MDDQFRLVIVSIGEQLFGVDAIQTLELVRQEQLLRTRAPGMADSVDGVADHRGALIPVLDARSLLGFQTLDGEITQLREMLIARENEHLAWIAELRRCVDTGDRFTKQTDPTKCNFGVWYDKLTGSEEELQALTKGNIAMQATLEQMDGPHRALHALAERVLAISASGDRDRARRLIEEAEGAELAQVRMLFDRLVEQFTGSRKPMLVIAEVCGERLGLRVDSVRSIELIDESDIQPLPEDLAHVGSSLRGFIELESGERVSVVELELLLRLCGGAAAIAAAVERAEDCDDAEAEGRAAA